MRIRSAADLGALIRERRTHLDMDQAALAKAAGTSRKWLVEVEKGKARAEFGLILKTLGALGMTLDAQAELAAPTAKGPAGSTAIETLLSKLKKKP